MKKFILIASIVVVLTIVTYRAVYYGDFYLPFLRHGEITSFAETREKQIYVDGKLFEVRGVTLSTGLPGAYASDYSVDKKTWKRWFKSIQDMGANTIRIYNVYDSGFYDAFYEYNKGKSEPLYLLQGIQVSDYANNSAQDAYSEEFFDTLKEHAKIAVDVIHGRKNIELSGETGSGTYRKDVSDWVIGYVVGSEWNSSTIAYTNSNKNYSGEYEGKYFSTTEDANAFEALLAKVMDTLIYYEGDKYRETRLISFVNEPLNDPFEYDEYYAEQLGKCNCIDAQNIYVNSSQYKGYFAAYQVYEFCPQFSDYFSDEQKSELANVIGTLNEDMYYGGYTKLLAEYHTMPVVVVGYGYSTARGTDSLQPALTEKEQGEKLLSAYNDIVTYGCAGALIDTWQDSWERISWNTSYAVDLGDNKNWHDVQTVNQSMGILKFESGKNGSICYVDGDISEWTSKPVAGSRELNLWVMYDAEYMYLMAKGDTVSPETPLYIPIETLIGQGSDRYRNMLSFEYDIDFLVYINGTDDSEILVQERYDSLRENYLEKIMLENPFENVPRKDSKTFVSITMLLKNSVKEVYEIDDYPKFKTLETGVLRYGNANPESETYDSLADFCYGENCVEIRIPWALINFSDPSEMQIHKDYYENYGREEQNVEKIYLGVTDKVFTGEDVDMNAVKLSGWGGDVEYKERLKDSYYILQEGWRR